MSSSNRERRRRRSVDEDDRDDRRRRRARSRESSARDRLDRSSSSFPSRRRRSRDRRDEPRGRRRRSSDGRGRSDAAVPARSRHADQTKRGLEKVREFIEKYPTMREVLSRAARTLERGGGYTVPEAHESEALHRILRDVLPLEKVSDSSPKAYVLQGGTLNPCDVLKEFIMDAELSSSSEPWIKTMRLESLGRTSSGPAPVGAQARQDEAPSAKAEERRDESSEDEMDGPQPLDGASAVRQASSEAVEQAIRRSEPQALEAAGQRQAWMLEGVVAFESLESVLRREAMTSQKSRGFSKGT